MEKTTIDAIAYKHAKLLTASLCARICNLTDVDLPAGQHWKLVETLASVNSSLVELSGLIQTSHCFSGVVENGEKSDGVQDPCTP